MTSSEQQRELVALRSSLQMRLAKQPSESGYHPFRVVMQEARAIHVPVTQMKHAAMMFADPKQRFYSVILAVLKRDQVRAELAECIYGTQIQMPGDVSDRDGNIFIHSPLEPMPDNMKHRLRRITGGLPDVGDGG